MKIYSQETIHYYITLLHYYANWLCIVTVAVHLRVRCNTDFVYIFKQRRFYICVWLVASRVARKKFGHDMLRYVSKFRRSEHDNYFFIGKKPSQKHFEKNNSMDNMQLKLILLNILLIHIHLNCISHKHSLHLVQIIIWSIIDDHHAIPTVCDWKINSYWLLNW